MLVLIMIKYKFLILFLIHDSLSSPLQDVAQVIDDFQDVIFKNQEINSINQPIANFHNNHSDLTAICWSESHIITENKHTKEQTISKAYSILLDTPGNLVNPPEGSQNVSCFEVLDQNTMPKKVLNFTTVKETENLIVKEHKTLFCGVGPVLSHHYLVWPRLKRKQIEISINPLGGHTLRKCSDIEDESEVGSPTEDYDSLSTPIPDMSSYTLGSSNFNVEDDTEEPFDEERDTFIKKIGAMHGDSELIGKGTNDDDGEDYPEVLTSPHATIEDTDEENSLVGKADRGVSERALKPGKRSKVTKSLLFRNFTCDLDSFGICNDIKHKIQNFVGTSNSTKNTLGKWFFPDSVLEGLTDENRSFLLNIQVVVTLEKQNVNSEEVEKLTTFFIREQCLYVVPIENKTRRHSYTKKEGTVKKQN